MAAKISLNLPGGVKMPALGIGTWQALDKAELASALNLALEAGYRHIDTAFVYQTEKVIGNVLKEWFNSGKLKREDIFITTKLPLQGVHADRVEHFMKKSLENLQLDYVDLYLVHFPIGVKYDTNEEDPKAGERRKMELEPKTDHVAVWKKMEEQVDAGRAKTIGLSNYNVAQIETVLKSARIKPANLQVELHLLMQQRKLVDFCKKNDISVVAYCPLGAPNRNQFLKSIGRKEIELPNILGNSVINKIAQRHSKTPAQVALRFLLQLGIAAIPKSVTPKRVKENIDIFDFTLDASEFKELSNLEVGVEARIVDFKFIDENIDQHPDYPFNDY